MTTEQHQFTGKDRCFVLRPNSGLYWRTTLGVFIGLSVVCLAVAIAFTLAGYWPVLPFAGLELVALGAALYVSAKRGRYREVVRVDGDRVTVEKGLRSPEQSWTFDLAWTEVELTAPLHRWYNSVLVIRSQGQSVAIGSFLTDVERRLLAEELRRCIGPIAVRGQTV